MSKKSISQIIREGLSVYLKKTNNRVKAQLVLEAKDEQEGLGILSKDERIAEDEFAKEFNL